MQVKLKKTFPVAANADAAWRLLQDIQSAAECVPGAQVTERLDDSHYKGQVKFRLGPVSAAFDGSVEIKEIAADARRIHILGKGSDATGTSAASMDLTAYIRPTQDGQCEIVGVSEISVSGKMVAFGSRMINQVADQVLKQFGDNFAERAQAAAASSSASEAPTETAQPKELNGLVFLWNIVAGFFKALFEGRKTAPSAEAN